MFLDIYKEWVWRDSFVNKGTPTLNAGHYLTDLLYYSVVTISDKQRVEKDSITKNMNLVLFYEIMPAKGKHGLHAMIHILKEQHQDPLADWLFEIAKEKGITIDTANWLKQFEEKVSHKQMESYFDKEMQMKSIWFDVKLPVQSFTGRKQELQELHNLSQEISLSKGKRGNAVFEKMTIISGLGGVGKTQVVAKYVEKYSKDYSYNVVWINAETDENLQASFTRLAEGELGINIYIEGRKKDIKIVVNEAYKFFASKTSLFIFDNAEQLNTENGIQGISEFLPQANPRAKIPFIFVTTRNQKWGDVKMLVLPTFTNEDAAELIKDQLNITDDSQHENVAKLSETLQNLPLALQQALSYIKVKNSQLKDVKPQDQFTIENYLQEFEKNSNKLKTLLNYKFPNWSDEFNVKTTFVTWKITVNRLESNNDNNNSQALQLLKIISFFAPDNIPMKLLLHLVENDTLQLGEYVDLLKQYSLVQSESGYLFVHRLVQQVTRLELEENQLEELIMKDAFELLKHFYPQGHTLSDLVIKRELLPHFEHIEVIMTKWISEHPKQGMNVENNYLLPLLGYIHDGYWTFQHPEKQVKFLSRRLTIQYKLYPHNHPEIAVTLANMGLGYGSLGNHNKKKELLEKALLIKEKHYGPDHFETAMTLVNLSIAYGSLGDHYKKKGLLEKALVIQEKHFGHDFFETAITLMNLGNTYGSLGDHSKEKELLEKALLITENHYGPCHFETSKPLTNLGNAYGNLGDHNKKKELLEKALLINEKHYGLDHFETAITLVNLGNAYGSLGDQNKEKEFLEKALLIQEKHYGPDQYETAITLMNLGNVYGRLGNHNKQKELLENALLIGETHYGPDHIEVAKTLTNLGTAYGSLGDHNKEKELLEKALLIQEKHYCPDHFEIAKTLTNLGTAYGSLGDHNKEKELLEKALLIKEKHYGPDHFEAAKTLANLSNVYGSLGDHKMKKELLEKTLVINEKHYGLDHFETAITLMNLGNAYGSLGDHNKKKEFLEKALLIQEKHGPDQYETAITLMNLGNAYGSLGDHYMEKKFLEKALLIEEKHYGPDHFEVAKTLTNLGTVYGV